MFTTALGQPKFKIVLTRFVVGSVQRSRALFPLRRPMNSLLPAPPPLPRLAPQRPSLLPTARSTLVGGASFNALAPPDVTDIRDVNRCSPSIPPAEPSTPALNERRVDLPDVRDMEGLGPRGNQAVEAPFKAPLPRVSYLTRLQDPHHISWAAKPRDPGLERSRKCIHHLSVLLRRIAA
jgi:hypothetical protein